MRVHVLVTLVQYQFQLAHLQFDRMSGSLHLENCSNFESLSHVNPIDIRQDPDFALLCVVANDARIVKENHCDQINPLKTSNILLTTFVSPAVSDERI